ncbi:MAG TPA: hypothetical protein VMS38_07835 [Pseudorhodoferax sp.]|nr:hypothetical protein [Pseudorhodoferax sp.]
MKRLLELFGHRVLRLAASAVVMAALAACGPGTGGTGTGPGMSAGLAAGTYNGLLNQGALPTVPLPCGEHCGAEVSLSVSEARVELSLPCQRFVYDGHWAFDSMGQAELVGRWQQLVQVGDEAVLEQQSARLALTVGLPDEQGLRVQLTVTGLDGLALVGPVQLQGGAQAKAGAAISCL